MKDILLRLYKGEIYPSENIVPTDTNYRELTHTRAFEREYFYKILSKADKERLNKLDDLYHEISSMDSYAHYTYGFRLGAMIMMAVLGGEEEQKE